MNELVFLRPLLGVVLLGLFALLAFRVARDRSLGAWSTVVEPHLMEAMTAMGKVTQQGRSQLLSHPLLWSLLFAIPAIAGPALSTRDASAYRNLDGVVIVLDGSPSVADDGPLAELTLAARSALQSIGSRPAALIVYAGDSYVASEFTTDTKQIEFTLQLLDKDTIPDPGSRPELALERATHLITQAKILRSDIVWLTDGGGVSPALFAELEGVLANTNSRLSVISASQDGEDQLAAWARAKGIGYFDPYQIDEMGQHLSTTPQQTFVLSDLRLLTHKELGPLFLLPAAFFLLLWFRRTA